MRLSYTITQTHGRTRRSAVLASENNSKQLIYTSTTRDSSRFSNSLLAFRSHVGKAFGWLIFSAPETLAELGIFACYFLTSLIQVMRHKRFLNDFRDTI